MGSVTKFVIATALILAAIYLCQPYRIVVVTGRSMEPTFANGQILLSGPLYRNPRRGDVVILEHDGTTIIKRVAMVAGDRYAEVYVPTMHEWTYMKGIAAHKMVKEGKVACRIRTVPAGKMFVLGDNRGISLDSRTFGFVPVDSVRGLVKAVS